MAARSTHWSGTMVPRQPEIGLSPREGTSVTGPAASSQCHSSLQTEPQQGDVGPAAVFLRPVNRDDFKETPDEREGLDLVF